MPQYFDSTAARPMKTKRSVYAKGGRAKYYGGGRTNLLEELGRVESLPSIQIEEPKYLESMENLTEAIKKVAGFKKLINQLKQEGRKENVHLLQNQDVQEELKL